MACWQLLQDVVTDFISPGAEFEGLFLEEVFLSDLG